MSQLDELLERIDPRKTIDRGNALLDKALNSYPFPNSQVDNKDEFMKVCGDFYWHVESTLLDLGPNISPEDKWKQSLAANILHDIYGEHKHDIHGRYFPDEPYRIARSGVEGGLYGVLRRIGEAMAKKHVENQIAVEVGEFVSRLMNDLPEYHATAREYAQKYGQLLPREALEDNAIDIAVNFGKILNSHPYMIKRMREIGRL